MIGSLKRLKNYLLFAENEYVPTRIVEGVNVINPKSQAWVGLEKVIPDIVERFNIKRDSAIEFGVEHGYSTSALGSIFKDVIGVDSFEGDIHAGFDSGLFKSASEALSQYNNIRLIRSLYQDFIQESNQRFNLAHIDIIHTYEDTFACGDWAMQHCDVVVFHDTQSFVDVKKAVRDLALKYKVKFYNYPGCNGLGILAAK